MTAAPHRRHRPRAWVLLAALASLLSGCASVSPDGLRSDVAALTAQRTGSVADAALPAPGEGAEVQPAVQAWLAQPLTPEAAVRVALLNNPALRAQLAALGLADAERVQAITLPNPQVALARLANGHEREIERSLAFNLLSVITLPWRMERQAERMQIATLHTAQQVVLLAADTRRAWLRAAAAAHVAAAHDRMLDAAEAGTELARRMASVGHWSRLQWAREQAVVQDARARRARAQLAAAKEREQLSRLMGLWGLPAQQYQLADRLPALPAEPLGADSLEATALHERLDVQAARRQLDTDARALGWRRAGAVFGDVGLAYQRNTAVERSTGHHDITRGWELDVPLPLFDAGGPARSAAQAQLALSAARLQDTAVRARSEVRAAWLAYRTALDLARQQQDDVVPLRQLMVDETTLRYNGMLASVWDLLAQARLSTQAVADAVDAQRDFWLAETDLQLALTGTSPFAMAGAGSALPSPGSTSSATHPNTEGH